MHILAKEVSRRFHIAKFEDFDSSPTPERPMLYYESEMIAHRNISRLWVPFPCFCLHCILAHRILLCWNYHRRAPFKLNFVPSREQVGLVLVGINAHEALHFSRRERGALWRITFVASIDESRAPMGGGHSGPKTNLALFQDLWLQKIARHHAQVNKRTTG